MELAFNTMAATGPRGAPCDAASGPRCRTLLTSCAGRPVGDWVHNPHRGRNSETADEFAGFALVIGFSVYNATLRVTYYSAGAAAVVAWLVEPSRGRDHRGRGTGTGLLAWCCDLLGGQVLGARSGGGRAARVPPARLRASSALIRSNGAVVAGLRLGDVVARGRAMSSAPATTSAGRGRPTRP
jgi:hypothetical protein